MDKRETKIQAAAFQILTILKMLLPPFASLERVERSCKAHIAKRPMAYAPREFLADTYRFYKKHEEAKREYLEIERLGYMTDRDRMNFAEVLYRLNEHRAVINTLSSIIEKYPKQVNANWCLGMSYMKTGEFGEAAQYLSQAEVAGNKRFEDYWRIGYCYARTKQYSKALSAYEKALALDPTKMEVKKSIEWVEERIVANKSHPATALSQSNNLKVLPDPPMVDNLHDNGSGGEEKASG
jgi:tetratricopeptide (TPR) repeat protein